MESSLLPEPSDYNDKKKSNEPETLEFIPFKDCDAELVASWGEFVYGGVTHATVNHFLGSLLGYRSIIDGVSDVDITFRTTCVPSFDLDSRTVYIPIKPVNEGGFDESVANVVHELMHASCSPRFDSLVYVLYKELLLSCKNIIDKDTDTLVYYCLGNHDPKSVSTEDLMDIFRNELKDGSKSTRAKGVPVFSPKGEKFVLRCIQTAFTIWNSFEDIRIDYLTPQPLKKYRLKSEQVTWHKNYKEGFLESLSGIEELNNGVKHPLEIGLKSLLHFKGMIDHTKDLQAYNMEFSDIVDCGSRELPSLIHDILKDNFLHMYAAIWEDMCSDSEEKDHTENIIEVMSNVFDPDAKSGTLDEGIADEVFQKIATEEKSSIRYPGKDLTSENSKVGCLPTEQLVKFLDAEGSYGESMLATITDGDNRLPSTSTSVLETLKNLRKMVVAKVDTAHYTLTSIVIDLFA